MASILSFAVVLVYGSAVVSLLTKNVRLREEAAQIDIALLEAREPLEAQINTHLALRHLPRAMEDVRARLAGHPALLAAQVLAQDGAPVYAIFLAVPQLDPAISGAIPTASRNDNAQREITLQDRLRSPLGRIVLTYRHAPDLGRPLLSVAQLGALLVFAGMGTLFLTLSHPDSPAARHSRRCLPL